ncbi:MAG: sulfur carrier protein ThiS [Bacteroidales bacterium]|jgi:thiamine biosynthesis protein ThiS|nr:sulfur carrier protein ThiS [Bacteroidales bacterium]NLM92533.1 sulfur carrier protein ThiS [Bacteroidales bacterium]
MKITLNNRPEDLEGHNELTIKELLKVKNFTFKFLAVRINGKPVRTADYGNVVIREGDQVVVMHLISGG